MVSRVQVEVPFDGVDFVALNNGMHTVSEKLVFEAYEFQGRLSKHATLFDKYSNNAPTEWDRYDRPAWLDEVVREMHAEVEG